MKQKKSKRPKKSHGKIKSGARHASDSAVDAAITSAVETTKHASYANDVNDTDGNVHVNFRYFDDVECFSVWENGELKKFTAWLMKMKNRTPEQVKKQSHLHRNSSFATTLKQQLSVEVAAYSLRVDDKRRVHGFFIENNLFVVRLDRDHCVLPG